MNAIGQKASDRPTRAYKRKYVYDAIETIQSGEWAPPHDMLLMNARGQFTISDDGSRCMPALTVTT